MEILKNTNAELITQAKELIRAQKAKISYDKSNTDFYIDVLIKTANESARVVIKNHHTNLVRL